MAVEAHTDFVIGSIDVAGELVAGTSGFELVLEAHADIGIPGVLAVEMDGAMDTRDGLFIDLSGAMEFLGQPMLAGRGDAGCRYERRMAARRST